MPDQDTQRDRNQHLDVQDLVPRLMMRGGTDGLCGHGAPGGDAWDNCATILWTATTRKLGKAERDHIGSSCSGSSVLHTLVKRSRPKAGPRWQPFLHPSVCHD